MPKELEHQTSHTQYQIRINGAGVRFYNDMHKNMMTEFSAIARDNQDDYVDIVSVRTEILVNQYSYHQMKRHFYNAAPRETIGALLADAMDTAVANGANSISMPDEYVALAVWLADV